MKNALLTSAAAAALSLGAASVGHAASTLIYGFEAADTGGPVDGFARNGGPVTFTVTPVTGEGVTQGATAALLNVTPAGFAGAITSTLPSALSTPITDITLDLTVPTGFTYTGGYGLIGVTIFVSNATTGDFGEQFQVQGASERDFTAITPGTTKSLDIPLVGVDPSTGATGTYATLLSEGYLPSGFQFFFDKNAPAQVIIDNVQGVSAPEPASLGLLGGAGLLLARRRRA